MQIDINDLIGLPFCSEPEHGYGPNCFSCYGLLWEVYRRFGIEIPRINISMTACKEASNQTIMEEATRNWRKLEVPETPCAVLIRSSNPDYADHIGVYIGHGKMMHITLNQNVCVDRVSSWQKRIIGYYQYDNR